MLRLRLHQDAGGGGVDVGDRFRSDHDPCRQRIRPGLQADLGAEDLGVREDQRRVEAEQDPVTGTGGETRLVRGMGVRSLVVQAAMSPRRCVGERGVKLRWKACLTYPRWTDMLSS